ncbi:hypothetical protein N7447_009385 [Penicillium robsamsonii]|uniref:uncharacterized protein n=1 Tax=Penicillium robsamsonii TaxID=1792511 RepID=UPI002548DCDB|nr:uncharacterized protein N7447_009385 [Penicillium robsamsonii]KAJ5817152.1 hypothetical protein N7447_009385 [Penicillium robsamsonii]
MPCSETDVVRVQDPDSRLARCASSRPGADHPLGQIQADALFQSQKRKLSGPDSTGTQVVLNGWAASTRFTPPPKSIIISSEQLNN